MNYFSVGHTRQISSSNLTHVQTHIRLQCVNSIWNSVYCVNSFSSRDCEIFFQLLTELARTYDQAKPNVWLSVVFCRKQQPLQSFSSSRELIQLETCRFIRFFPFFSGNCDSLYQYSIHIIRNKSNEEIHNYFDYFSLSGNGNENYNPKYAHSFPPLFNVRLYWNCGNGGHQTQEINSKCTEIQYIRELQLAAGGFVFLSSPEHEFDFIPTICSTRAIELQINTTWQTNYCLNDDDTNCQVDTICWPSSDTETWPLEWLVSSQMRLRDDILI